MDFLRRHWRSLILPAALLLVLLWAALAPVRSGGVQRELLLDIPKGTAARLRAGGQSGLPATVYLTRGVHDVLLLRNRDSVPQVFGPVLLMPGKDFSLPFGQVGEQQFACTAQAGGQVTVVVEALPYPGLGRLRWRIKEWSDALRRFTWIPPQRPAPATPPAQ